MRLQEKKGPGGKGQCPRGFWNVAVEKRRHKEPREERGVDGEIGGGVTEGTEDPLEGGTSGR